MSTADVVPMDTTSGPPGAQIKSGYSRESLRVMDDIREKLNDANSLADTPREFGEKAVVLYREVIFKLCANKDDRERLQPSQLEELLKLKEAAVLNLAKLYVALKRIVAVGKLLREIRPLLDVVSKAKAAKLVRSLIDSYLDADEARTGEEATVCKECIQWAKDENRVFLRHVVEVRLIGLLHENGKYQEALALSSGLVKEVKKLDDKRLVVETQLLESRVYSSLQNLPKARAALTTARTAANAIYCPPKLQAELDMQSGILHAADEQDFKTAYSYFYEAFEGYDSVQMSIPAARALKCMLLAKVMLGHASEVAPLIQSRSQKYACKDTEALQAIAESSSDRSLAKFQSAIKKYPNELTGDAVIKSHLDSLYDEMLSQNLSRLIEPFRRVQVDHVAQLINLPTSQVEKKLSQMILDKKCNGILSQGEGVLILYDEKEKDESYTMALETITHLSSVLDQLYEKAKKLH